MARYSYRGYDSRGRPVSGELDSPLREAAYATLKKDGTLPVELVEIAAAGQSRAQPSASADRPSASAPARRPTISGADRLQLTRELASLVQASLPVDECLRITASSPRLPATARRILTDVLERVVGGAGLAEALAAHGADFPPYVTRPIATAEAGGKLGPALVRLADLLERRAELGRRVRAALLYPAFLLVAAVLALTIVVGVLVPAIAPLFENTGAALPPVLALLWACYQAVAGNVLVTLALIAAAAALILYGVRNGWLGRMAERLALRLPIVARLVRNGETQRFAATLSMLLSSGVPLLDALRITATALQTSAYRTTVSEVAEAIAQGGSLGGELARRELFEEIAVRLVAVGERTGQIDVMLDRLARILDETQRHDLDRLVALIGPLMTVLIGLLVGLVVVSIAGAIGGINELAFR